MKRLQYVKCLIGIVLLLILAVITSGCGSSNSKNLISVPSDYSAFLGKPQSQVTRELENEGFSDFEYVVIEDLTSKSKIKDGAVDNVSIDGEDHFDINAQFPPDAHIIITYHAIPRTELPVGSVELQTMDCADISELFLSSGFEDILIEEVYDIDPDEDGAAFYNEVRVNNHWPFSEGDLVPFDSEIRIISHYPFEKYTLHVDIKFLGNLIFNKYNVDVFLDGEKQVHLPHGEDGAFDCRLREGEYTLTFEKVASPEVSGEISFYVDCDIDAEYKITCYSERIEIEENYIDYKRALSDNEAKVMGTKYGYIGQNYHVVVSSLEELGFTNITSVPVYDIIWGITEIESTSGVTIDGRDDFKRGDVFRRDAAVVVTYHLNYSDSPEYKEAHQTPTPTATPVPTAKPSPSASTPIPTQAFAETPMPVMSGTSLSDVLDTAKAYGLARAFSDEDFGHGTSHCTLESGNGGLSVDVIYSDRTQEVLCGTIVTFNYLSTTSEQLEFIKAMAGVLCPEADKQTASGWVNANVGNSKETTINGFVYEVGKGETGNLLYFAGVRNWEEWELSLD